ncbi:RHS repeat-associated core domain-containing protein [Streptomyces sp. NPDC050315]|uniref:RHS repeat-associated core domain-containing protein n=1 Tax=Streptomyces sp. NPDC050315 TaxID=3155039 RepID=UPI003418AAD3
MLTKVVQDAPASGSTPAVKSQDTFTYDAAGNTEKRVLGGDTQNLSWNAAGDLTKSTAGAEEATFAYDAAGERVLRKEPDAPTFYLPGMELRLDAASKAITAARYYVMGDKTVALRTKHGVQFLSADSHGTAQIAVNAATGETARRRMDPFGGERGGDESAKPWVDDKGFLGKPVDESTGLTHIGAREYEPENGRFISADPLIDFTDPQQINGYAYANNSPVSFSDPTGLILYHEVTKLGYGNAQVLHNRIARDPAAYQRTLADSWVSYQRYWSQKQSPAQEKADRARAAANAAK